MPCKPSKEDAHAYLESCIKPIDRDAFDRNVKLWPNRDPEFHLSAEERQVRSPLASLFGKLFFQVTIAIMLFVGVQMNLLQLLLRLSVPICSSRPELLLWNRKLNGFCCRIIYSFGVFFIERWNGVSMRYFVDDLEIMKLLQHPHRAIVVPNHSYQADGILWVLVSQGFGKLETMKPLSKEEVKYIPVIGWAGWLSGHLFVKRNWAADQKSIRSKFERLLQHEQLMIGIFAEGARWKPDTYEASCNFLESRGQEPYKYHLAPRTKGFVEVIRQIVRREPESLKPGAKRPLKIINLQLVSPVNYGFRDLISGSHFKADIYCEETKLTPEAIEEALQESSEPSPHLTQLVYQMFRRKDELFEEHLGLGGRFKLHSPRSGIFRRRSSFFAMAVWCLGFLYTFGLLGYFSTGRLGQSHVFWYTVASFVVASMMFMRRIGGEINQQSRSNVDRLNRMN